MPMTQLRLTSLPFSSRGRWTRRLAPALVAALLAGCSLGPHYKRPAVTPPAAWQTSAGAKAAWPSVDWWRGFGSPQLNDLIAQAEAANYDLAAAIARVREADAQARIAGAPLLPSVGAGAGLTYQKPPLQAANGSQIVRPPQSTVFNPAVNASYELDFWGKNQAALEAAQATAQASRYDQQTIKLTVETSVAATYFQIVAFHDRLAVAQANIDSANDVLKALREEEQVGTATALDVAQQETTAATLEAQVPPLRQQLQQTIDALAILVAKSPGEVAVTTGTLTDLAQPGVAPGLPSELLARRPDIAEAEAQLVSANANIRVARAAFFPSIDLTAEGGVASVALAACSDRPASSTPWPPA